MSRWLMITLVLVGCGMKPPQGVTVIHIANWHWISKTAFAADLRDLDPTLTDTQIDERFAQYLDDVEEVQRQQIVLIRELSKIHGLRRICYEGVTEENLEACRKSVERVKRLDTLQAELDAFGDCPEGRALTLRVESLRAEMREESLQLGAIGYLIRTGEIDDYLPLEDQPLLMSSDPIQKDGKISFDPLRNEAREDAMAERLLAAGPVAIVILGGDHDLEDNLKKLLPSVKYGTLRTAKYQDLHATR